jgi:hypothetical protein
MVLTAAGMVVFLGFAALAVDVGLLAEAQTQAQRAADSGALAGAGILLRTPTEHAEAKAEAELFTEKHEILNEPIDIDQAQDVEIEGDTLVRVFVRRTQAVANPISLYFARVLGIVDADMTVHAAAIVAPAAATSECLWPFIPPDVWKDDLGRSNDVVFTDFDDAPHYVEGSGDFYNPPSVLGAGYPAYTGWGAIGGLAPSGDQGRYLIGKTGDPGDFATAGWWYPMNNPPTEQAGGMAQLRAAIRGECGTSYTLDQGDEANLQTGFGGGAIRAALQEPLAWGPTTAAQAIACYSDPASCAETDTRRIRTMPLYDPRFALGPGASTPATVGNFAKIWVAGFCNDPGPASDPHCAALPPNEQNDTFAVMYLGPTTGYAAEPGGGASSGVLAVRLVE